MGEYLNRRIPLPESPESAIIPGMAVWRHLFVLLLLVPGAFAQAPSRVASTLSGLLAMKPGETQPHVQVLGFSSPGDWGPPKTFRYDATNALATNAIRRATAIGSGRWVHDWDGDVRAFGAKGDGVTDDTAAFQAAASAMEGIGGEVFLPVGNYVVDTVTYTNVSWRGVKSARPSQSGSLVTKKAGTTGGLFVPRGNSWQTIKDIAIRGTREQSLLNPKAITAVSSRFQFTVALADLPTAPASVANFPFYGFAFFYSSENRYLGSAVISGVNTGTGVITIYTGFDNYAVPSGTGGLLTTACKVVFSPVTSYTGTYGTYTDRIDPAAAGQIGIDLLRANNQKFENVTLERLHTAIRFGDGLWHEFIGVKTYAINFAAFANHPLNAGADHLFTDCFIQGFYSQDNNLPAESGTFVDVGYRRTAFGLYGIPITGRLGNLTIDSCNNGMLEFGSYDWEADTILIDKPHKEAYISVAGSANGSPLIDKLQIRTCDKSPAFWSGFVNSNRAAIALGGGTPVVLRPRILQISRFPGSDASNDFNVVASIFGSNDIDTRLVGLSGYASLYSGSTVPSFAKGKLELRDNSRNLTNLIEALSGYLNYSVGGTNMFSWNWTNNTFTIFGPGAQGQLSVDTTASSPSKIRLRTQTGASTATVSGAVIGQINGEGNTGSGFTTDAAVARFLAAGNWSGSSTPSDLAIRLTDSSQTANREVFRVLGNGGLSLIGSTPYLSVTSTNNAGFQIYTYQSSGGTLLRVRDGNTLQSHLVVMTNGVTTNVSSVAVYDGVAEYRVKMAVSNSIPANARLLYIDP